MHKWDAEAYNRNSSAQRGWAMELIEKLRLRGDERVLDVGCGDGKITLDIAGRTPRGSVVGIDYSPEMIEFARARLAESGITNAEFRLMDAAEMDFTEEFDVAFSNAVLHWVKDNLAVLRGVHRALKPGGRILFQMGGQGNAAYMYEAVSKLMNEDKWKKYFHDMIQPYFFLGADEYLQLLVEADLKPVRVELIPKDMAHEGADGLAGWFRTTNLPYIKKVPENMREEFIEAVISAYMHAHPLDEYGKSHLPMVRLEVEAVK